MSRKGSNMSIKEKYKIKEKLKSLPFDEFKIAQEKLPVVLKVSTRTFKRWQNAKVGDKLEIPSDKLWIIAKCLNTPIEKMFNYTPPTYSVKNLKSVKAEDFSDEFGLTK